ncbi:MAG: hypothetical protein E7676_01610 [Ruminococcaceae bacterium]|nr:hypothetical protein [Oscillospiraceae bacterium]
MKKLLGVVPLLTYLFATLALVGFGVLLLTTADLAVPDDAGLGEVFFDVTINLGAKIFVILIFILACIPLLMFIFKLIHLATGATFFGAFCVIIDIIVTVALFILAFNNSTESFIAIVAFAELGCCVCNIISAAR